MPVVGEEVGEGVAVDEEGGGGGVGGEGGEGGGGGSGVGAGEGGERGDGVDGLRAGDELGTDGYAARRFDFVAR